jgi:hypothetical protein
MRSIHKFTIGRALTALVKSPFILIGPREHAMSLDCINRRFEYLDQFATYSLEGLARPTGAEARLAAQKKAHPKVSQHDARVPTGRGFPQLPHPKIQQGLSGANRSLGRYLAPTYCASLARPDAIRNYIACKKGTSCLQEFHMAGQSVALLVMDSST